MNANITRCLRNKREINRRGGGGSSEINYISLMLQAFMTKSKLAELKKWSRKMNANITRSLRRKKRDRSHGREKRNQLYIADVTGFYDKSKSTERKKWLKKMRREERFRSPGKEIWKNNQISGAFILSNTLFWKVAMFRAPVYTCAETSPTEKLSDVLACFSW